MLLRHVMDEQVDTCGDMGPNDQPYPHGGSSVFSEVNVNPQWVEVAAIDIAQFILDLKVRPEDFVVMKMDIESQEYIIMRHLLQKGLLCLIDELYIEWHRVPAQISQYLSKDVLKPAFEFLADGCVGHYRGDWI